MMTAAQATAQASDRLITQPINEQRTVVLSGNTRSEAKAANDRGAFADGQVLNPMQRLLNRPADREAALQGFIAGLNNPRSAYYHAWVTAEQFGTMFGPDEADVSVVTGWLQSHGLTVNEVQPNRMVIDVSGDAGAIRSAFATSIHHISVGGVMHIANMSDPRIPAALAGIIHGIVSLNDFRPHPLHAARPAYTFSSGSSTIQAVVPADLATIYNFNPLFAAGISGQGQTIVVIEDTDVYDTADWVAFRSALGLSGYMSGSLVETHPSSVAQSCSDPGVVAGNESEAALDAEWAGAAAPNATIELASCSDTSTTFGGLIALENLLNAGSPPAIVSISYGECEAENGATANAAFSATYEQAVSQGVSVFVAAGDEGAASCDADETRATHGLGASGFASTPYNVPEIAWNDSCASALLTAAAGYSTSTGFSGFCNSQLARQYYLSTASGSGGPSGCATGSPYQNGVVGGSCQGYAKPSWQALLGNPADGVRDIPDIAMFAANGVWGHYYVFCDSDVGDGGAACTGAPSTWSGAGGASFASPIMAGVQALVNQNQGARQGNPNPVYYAIANAEYGSAGSAPCNSTTGNATGSTCVFYDVTQGDIDVNCAGFTDCYTAGDRTAGDRNGVLSTSSYLDAPAYGTATGWDFATGIGSVNVTNLVNGWTAGQAEATSAAVPPN